MKQGPETPLCGYLGKSDVPFPSKTSKDGKFFARVSNLPLLSNAADARAKEGNF